MVEPYAGLDVSDKSTTICVIDAAGATVWAGACASDPEVIARALKTRAPRLARAVLETGPLSTFLYRGLVERGTPAICICARHAKKALSARVNKSDPLDAEGLAQMARTGWFKAVNIKSEATHLDRASLKIRQQLMVSRLAMAGQLRGLLKLFGLRLGKVRGGQAVRTAGPVVRPETRAGADPGPLGGEPRGHRASAQDLLQPAGGQGRGRPGGGPSDDRAECRSDPRPDLQAQRRGPFAARTGHSDTIATAPYPLHPGPWRRPVCYICPHLIFWRTSSGLLSAR